MTFQLVDRSIKHPKGIVEDLLVQINKFKVPTDFAVLEMRGALLRHKERMILLGRPFMVTMLVLGETV